MSPTRRNHSGKAVRFGSLVIVLSLVLPVSAEVGSTSKDPTVPHASWLATQPPPPESASVVAGDAARVKVTVVGRKRRLAIVDGKVVQVGDSIADTKVTEIRGYDVVLDGDKEKSLSATPNVEKKPPARPVHRKIVLIPEDGMSSMQTGSK